MIPYSFTKYLPSGVLGTEYLFPPYRSRIADKTVYINNLQQILGANGQYNANGLSQVANMKDFSIQFSLLADPPNSLLDNLMDAASLALDGNGVIKVQMDDGTIRWQEVIVESIDKSYAQRHLKVGVITLNCKLYPNWYSSIQNTSVISFTTGGTITNTSAYNLTNPLQLILQNISGGIVATPRIQNITSNCDITLTNLAIGETVTIDVGQNSVVRSTAPTVNNRKDIIVNTITQIELFKLSVGVNTIALTPNAAVNLTFKWYNNYR